MRRIIAACKCRSARHALKLVQAKFDLLACANIDEAIEIASKHPMALFGRIEVRPCGG
jgi:hypothetical protein